MQVRHHKLNSKGFTLIELLIVIIIIGILAAIAFVAYNGTQNKAHEASAQSTLSEAQSKLAEYNSDNGNYPATQAAFDSWLTSSSGGDNTTLASTLTTANGYTYTPNDGSGNSCDDSTTQCSAYSLTANASIWSGSSNITVTN